MLTVRDYQLVMATLAQTITQAEEDTLLRGLLPHKGDGHMAAVEGEVDLSKGGMVTVCLGKGFEAPSEFAFDPRVHFIMTAGLSPQALQIPSQTKILIVTDRIGSQLFGSITAVCRRRGFPYLPRKTDGAIVNELKKLLPAKPHTVPDANSHGGQDTPRGESPASAPASNGNGHGNGSPSASIPTTPTGMAPKGSIRDLAKEADLSKSSAEEGKRLYGIAQMRGIPTTLGSITQAISQLKRKGGRGDLPVSLAPQSVLLQLSRGITEAIEALQRIQVQAEELERGKEDLLAENQDLKARIQLLKEAFSNV
jgi:hypothetical protein